MRQRKSRFFPKPSAVIFLLYVLLPHALSAWTPPIQISAQSGVKHLKPTVCFSPAGKVFVVYEKGEQIHLSSYDGNSVAFVKKISESTLVAYEPAMWINRLGHIHIAWIEAASYAAETQHVRYRFFNGSSWSAVTTLKTISIPGTLPGGFVTRKVEDLRAAADENDNAFLAFMIWPSARCQFISKYGSVVKLETWPMSGRSKHPDVAVDANYVHVAWQQLWDRDYTVAYCRRANTVNGKWQTVIDIKDGIHRPRIAVDSSRVPHVFYMADIYTPDYSRNSIYKYWTGSGFSSKFVVSDDSPRLYSNLGLGVADSRNVFTMELANVLIFYNWKRNGEWSGHRRLVQALTRPDYTSAALSPNGEIAAIAYADHGDSIYLHVSEEDFPPPNNQPPTARFTFSPASGPLPLTVTFNASASTDPDGQILGYSWSFGDDSMGSGVATQHVFRIQKRCKITLTVTDNYGAAGTAIGWVDVLEPNRPPVARFTHAPTIGYTPLTVTFAGSSSSDSDGRIVSYKWDFADGKTASGSATKHVFTLKKLHPVVLTVTDDDGATDTATGYVRVLNRVPTAKISFYPVSGLYPLSVAFNAGGSVDLDGKIASYHWDYGDGSAGLGVSPTHLYQKQGRYRITLTVTDDNGAAAKATGEVEVFALNPPLDVQYARQENRNLFSFEYLYRLTWKANPRNEEIGARISSYRIYRREKGSAAAYGHLLDVPAGSQPDHEYIDRSLGRTAYDYEYRISSLDNAGRESILN
jgi:PKD repeat protein